MVRHIREMIEPELRNLGEHHTLARQAILHHHVKGTDPVGRDDQQRFRAILQDHVVKITNLATALVRQVEVGFENRLSHV